MMAPVPTVSVLLPAFNAALHLRSAIDSVLSQTLPDFELLVVDDGSADGTRDIVLSYDDSRIRLIENARNVGMTASLNRALELARGEYVARQDADDVSEPHRLREQVAYFARHPDVAMAGSWFTVIDAHGSVLRRTTLPVDDLDLRWAMCFSCPFAHSAVMWRRLPVRLHVGAYDERFVYAQDYELWTRIARRFHVGNVGDYLLRYRQHAGSMTATYADRTLEGHRLRVAVAGDVLGWPAIVEERERRFRAVSALVRPSQLTDLTAREVLRGVDDLRRLHAAMCRRWQVSPRAARRHRRAVRAAILAGVLRVSRRTTARFGRAHATPS